MKKLLFSLITVPILLSACSQEDISLSIEESTKSQVLSTRVSIAEALQHADRLLAQIEGPSTRSRSVKTIEFIGGNGTRTEGEEPLYYVVNYDNDGGFAVLGADTRLDHVYAISEEGHLDMNDTTFNHGLNIFFRSLASAPPIPVIPPETPDTTIHIIQPAEEQVTDLS